MGIASACYCVPFFVLVWLQVQRTVQPLFEEPEEEEVSSGATGTLVGGVKSKKPHPQTTVPSSGGKSAAKKSKVRPKQPLTGFGEPASGYIFLINTHLPVWKNAVEMYREYTS